jgi:hypothetical protein
LQANRKRTAPKKAGENLSSRLRPIHLRLIRLRLIHLRLIRLQASSNLGSPSFDSSFDLSFDLRLQAGSNLRPPTSSPIRLLFHSMVHIYCPVVSFFAVLPYWLVVTLAAQLFPDVREF